MACKVVVNSNVLSFIGSILHSGDINFKALGFGVGKVLKWYNLFGIYASKRLFTNMVESMKKEVE